MPRESLLPWIVRCWRPIPRWRFLARFIFGVDFLDVRQSDQYFDVTTPLLVRSAARRLKPGGRFLDMGTGAFAVIGLAIWRRLGCEVVSTDVHPDILERARANVALNRAPIRVVHSRFFEDIEGPFDAVTFNPPYIPTHLALDPTYARPFDFQSNGGPTGTSVIEGFFDAFAESGGSASGHLGMNEMFVSGRAVLGLLAARQSLVLESVDRLPGSPFYVIVFRRDAGTP